MDRVHLLPMSTCVSSSDIRYGNCRRDDASRAPQGQIYVRLGRMCVVGTDMYLIGCHIWDT